VSSEPTPIRALRVIGYLEGTSFLLLLFFAMPMKYIGGNEHPVEIIGAAHGGLWVLYIGALAWCWLKFKWPFMKAFWGGVASVLPFGPFIYDRKMLAK